MESPSWSDEKGQNWKQVSVRDEYPRSSKPNDGRMRERSRPPRFDRGDMRCDAMRCGVDGWMDGQKKFCAFPFFPLLRMFAALFLVARHSKPRRRFLVRGVPALNTYTTVCLPTKLLTAIRCTIRPLPNIFAILRAHGAINTCNILSH